MDIEGILKNRFMHTKIKHAIADNRHNTLRLRRIGTIGEAIHLNSDSKNMLHRIIKPELRVMLEITDNIYAGMPIPDKNNQQTILDMKKDRWLRGSMISSRKIRLLLKENELITNTKLLTFTPDEAATFYKNTHKLRSTQNKTKILRLVHGDVYCGERLKKFQMSEIDTCTRCFEKETIKHLQMEFPYTQEVWRLLGLNANDTKAVLGTYLTKEEFEIHADILSSIVFRKSKLPPNNTLIELTYLKYRKGVCRNNTVKDVAKAKIGKPNTTGAWRYKQLPPINKLPQTKPQH